MIAEISNYVDVHFWFSGGKEEVEMALFPRGRDPITLNPQKLPFPDVTIRLHHLHMNEVLQHLYDSTATVSSVLQVGGFGNKHHLYYQKGVSTGPKDRKFYDLTRCNLGTPEGLLLSVAEAASISFQDKKATTKLMEAKLPPQPVPEPEIKRAPEVGPMLLVAAVAFIAVALFTRSN